MSPTECLIETKVAEGAIGITGKSTTLKQRYRFKESQSQIQISTIPPQGTKEPVLPTRRQTGTQGQAQSVADTVQNGTALDSYDHSVIDEGF